MVLEVTAVLIDAFVSNCAVECLIWNSFPSFLLSLFLSLSVCLSLSLSLNIYISLSQSISLTSFLDQTCRLWWVDNSACLLQYCGHDGSVNSIRFHPASQELVLTACGDHTAHIWRAAVSAPSSSNVLDSSVSVMVF